MSTYQREKSPARALFVGGAMIVLLVVLFLVYRNSQEPKAPEPSLASFRGEVAALSLPAGTTPESPAVETTRIGSVTLTQRYALMQTGAEARTHLREALEARGWTYKSGSDGTPWSDTFCKPPLAAKLDFVQESGGGSTVSLALSWNELALLTCGGSAAAKP